MTPDLRYTLEELAQVASVPERQIRELVRLDVLPAPSSRGRGATYGAEHLDRLRAWKVLREKLPPRTTNGQIRILLDKLTDGGILRAIAEGSVPFELLDDGKEDVTVAETADSPFIARMSRETRTFDAVSQGSGINERALEYLSSMRRAFKRVTLDSVNSAPRVELGVGDPGQSAAGPSLQRLFEALRRYVAEHAAQVRVRPPKAETWHVVTAGNDLEISARGPLMPDEIQLLETVGQLLQQAIYRKEK